MAFGGGIRVLWTLFLVKFHIKSFMLKFFKISYFQIPLIDLHYNWSDMMKDDGLNF